MSSRLSREERTARRKKRREKLLQELDSSIPSPCTSVCQMDDLTQLCIGCHRTIDEIRDWVIMTGEEKQELLESIDQRRTGMVA
ncbi:DUF1289 domain-containing protein [uncultured Kiloniella sp.]|uniref:DUF1289 domain-containing protein n=1 Tax=uncultured Kiloniella sp. TaxID=1133091 RepID=UPI002619FD8D|nr:DUF1289 domain-containing protein [uncultured Kiloniella sp.]